MIILGIDPGVARVGYGVLEVKGDRVLASAHGCLETAKGRRQADRLADVRAGIRSLIIKYRPDAFAVEKLFFQKNVRTAMVVSEGRGVILEAASSAGIPVVEMTPMQVKLTVTGYGKADKRQVQEMVRRTLRLADIPKPDDAADALAIAITGMRLAREERLYGG